jgi:hypothetical protein
MIKGGAARPPIFCDRGVANWPGVFISAFPLGCLGLRGFPDTAGLVGLERELRALSVVGACGREAFSGLAMSIGGSKGFERACRLLWRLCPASAAGFGPGSKVNAEMASFL